MHPDDIPNMRPEPDAGAAILWIVALALIFVVVVSVVAVVEFDVYRECREHGFSATYCLWK